MDEKPPFDEAERIKRAEQQLLATMGSTIKSSKTLPNGVMIYYLTSNRSGAMIFNKMPVAKEPETHK